ncbi:MAG: TIM44-like domain-containing protein [Rhodoplanes sp.]|uniref:Tim44 domain-containing protein n=1 Tax=Rhodoplanes sp. TaxID=1968906 RepID=UPI0017A154D0|nr:TIM44-like domain-containing protein [Rhodoplanes sp.]NVO12561.1 TIM44-like domain-containing protein [Rhodoplanes sp.]
MFGSRTRPILLSLAVACALVMVAGDAAWSRAGGGSSFGSRGTRTYSAPAQTRTAPTAAPVERSMTQPGTTRPNAAGPATTGMAPSRPGLFGGFGGGMLGGLAAGFLGAGLLGMLTGHGFMGGLGGFASMLGLLLQIGLVAFLGMFLWRMWQSRRAQQPAMASGPHLRDIGGGQQHGIAGMPLGLGGLGGGGGAAAPERSDEVGIGPAEYDAFEHLLGDVQGAFSTEDLSALRTKVTPEMLSYFSEQFAENASRGVINQVSDVKLEQGDLAEAWREGDTDYATVAMRFSLVDRMVDRASGKVVSGGEGRETVTELWTFRRARGGAWMLSAIQQAR